VLCCVGPHSHTPVSQDRLFPKNRDKFPYAARIANARQAEWIVAKSLDAGGIICL